MSHCAVFYSLCIKGHSGFSPGFTFVVLALAFISGVTLFSVGNIAKKNLNGGEAQTDKWFTGFQQTCEFIKHIFKREQR